MHTDRSRFDEIIDRRNTDSLKYDFAAERGRPADILPLWVADMDFRAPDAVSDALRNIADHGIFGYTETKADYFEAVAGWFARRFGATLEAEHLVKTPGMVFALACAVRALTRAGDAVMIQPPVYYPFAGVVRANGRTLVENELICENGRYRIDFADMEEKIRRHKVRLLLFCSPHNPVGRVWTADELRKVGELCKKYGVVVFSDEIHCDFTYEGVRHRLFLDVNPDLAAQTILGTSPAKTFNLAGLQITNVFIPDEGVRRAFRDEIAAAGYSQLNVMALAACKAAYRHGEPWLEELKVYLQGNLDFLRNFFENRLPFFKLTEPEGTYLAWFDCAETGLDRRELEHFFRNEAKVWLDRGSMFGGRTDTFQRINLACPRKILEEALLRMESAWQRRNRTGNIRNLNSE